MKFPFKIYVFSIFTFALKANAQQDSIPKNNKLDEVVITGQYNPQSVNKSVFQVKVISRADIDRQAGNNLADLLNQTLNINIIPSASSGKSSVKLFGLDAQYFKILVDNIPLLNDEGLGNNADLTQLNLDDVQQIEIVEGSMGVEYGANAISGIINIITKKSGSSKWEITPTVQEETVGSEYSLYDRGRHIQSLKIGHNFNSKLYANALITTNYFKGFFNDKKGKNHVGNDGLRGYEWLPKDQVNVKSFLGYNLQHHRFFYKFEYFNENTDFYTSDVVLNPDPQYDLTHPQAFDDNIFKTTRYFHHLNASGRFENTMNYDISVSFQQQERNVEVFNYWIRTGVKEDIREFEYESREGFYSKGNFSNFLKGETIDFQLGYEVSDIDGLVSTAAGMFTEGGVQKRLGSYDVFGSTEINLNNKFSIRPGARALFSSKFDTQAALSLSAKYLLGGGYELRAIVGTAPRLPNYDELYTYFKDVNHDSQGNPNLKPEQGLSASLYLNKTFESQNELRFSNTFSAWYIDVSDRIEQIQYTNSEGKLAFTFTNIDLFRTLGATLTSSAAYNNLTVNAGMTLSGVSKVLDSNAISADDYLYAMQFNVNASYLIPKWKTVFSAYLKYTGPQYQFIQRNDENLQPFLVKGKQDEFTWMDASVRKTLLSNRLEITAGARNILDITSINTSDDAGGTHAGPASSILMGYGRSYFLKLLYRLNF